MKTQVNWFGRILLIGLLCLLFAVMVPVRVLAETYGGNCGAQGYEANVTWSYDTVSKILTISGSGKMADYASWDDRPWNNYIDAATNITVGNQITNIGKWSFNRDSNAGTCAVTIPGSITEIGEYAFMSCKFSSLVIDWSGVETIGKEAFAAVTFPTGTALTFDDTSNITSIARKAFVGSKNLTSVAISRSNVSIGEMAFCDSESLASVSITGDYTSISEEAFSYSYTNSSISSITIGGQGTTIGEKAFFVPPICSASVNSLTLLEGITTIGEEAFDFNSYNGCQITSITLPTTLTDIGSYALSGMGNLQTLYIPGEGRQFTNNILNTVNPNATIIHAASTNVSGISDRDVDRVEYTRDGDSVSVTVIDGTEGTPNSVTIPTSIPKSADASGDSYSIAAVLHKQGVAVQVP
ncbi:MAG: leucine-rich repeat domain-containing protein, partial [bacterium]|nr:leucine-rich repeat domain-containing protein [bacterium]